MMPACLSVWTRSVSIYSTNCGALWNLGWLQVGSWCNVFANFHLLPSAVVFAGFGSVRQWSQEGQRDAARNRPVPEIHWKPGGTPVFLFFFSFPDNKLLLQMFCLLFFSPITLPLSLTSTQNQPLSNYGRPKGDGEVRVASVDKRAKQDRWAVTPITFVWLIERLTGNGPRFTLRAKNTAVRNCSRVPFAVKEQNPGG